MKTILTMILSITTFPAYCQTTISGKVVSENGDPITGANIYLENSYDGASSDANGEFIFTCSESGSKNLIASFIGYKQWQQEIELSDHHNIQIKMKESVNTLGAVSIVAGNFAAADETRASVMKPLDIYTTPSANGDVMAAIRTMPGTQAAPDDGRLLVRGGDSYETATYIDGLIAAKPYYSKTPDIATRGRFAPSLFNGVQFNTGGYSAEYGQALSSVLVLNSNDLAEENVTGISLMSIGAEANYTNRWEKSSLTLSGGYTNFAHYYQILNSSIDWEKPVEAMNGTAVYRYKPRSTGMLKVYFTTDFGDLAYNVPAGANGESMLISNKSKTLYSNLSYRDCFSEKSCYKIGVSSTIQKNLTGWDSVKVETRDINFESRISIIHDVFDGLKITWGANQTFNQYKQDYKEFEGNTYFTDFTDHLTGAFFEPEIKF